MFCCVATGWDLRVGLWFAGDKRASNGAWGAAGNQRQGQDSGSELRAASKPARLLNKGLVWVHQPLSLNPTPANAHEVECGKTEAVQLSVGILVYNV